MKIKLSILGSAIAMAVLWAATPGSAAETFRSGDSFVVAQQGAALKRGNETLATLAQGQRLRVVATEGDWIGTSVVVKGQTVGGWIHKAQAATPAQYAQRATQRRYSLQPGATEGGVAYPSSGGSSRSSSGRGLIMGHTQYGPSYWRADRKISGY